MSLRPEPGTITHDLLQRSLTALDALDLMDIYRALPEKEQERVSLAAHDAERRQTDPLLARQFSVLESFASFAEYYERGEAKEQVCFLEDLTPDQYEKYRQAWQAVQAVHDAVSEYCNKRYGERESKP